MSYVTGITKSVFCFLFCLFYMLDIYALIVLHRIGLIALAMHTECWNSMQCFFLKLYLITFQLQTLFMKLLSKHYSKSKHATAGTRTFL